MDHSLASYGFPQFATEDPNSILPYNPTNYSIHDDKDFVEYSHFGSYSDFESNLNEQSFEGETLVLKTPYDDQNLCNLNEINNANASDFTSTNFIAFGYPNSTPQEEHRYDGGSSYCDEAMPQILNFSSNAPQTSSYKHHSDASVMCDVEMKIENNTTHKSPLQVQEHVVAERLRRQKLNKLFIGLSAHLPGLKKLDKASILKDAVEYIKQLEEHSKVLEEEAKKLQLAGKSTLINKSSSRMNEDDGSDQYELSNAILSDVKARVCDEEILIRIHCKKPKQATTYKLLAELEKLHLNIINCSVIPFDENRDITIIAQRNIEFSIPRKELVEKVKSAIIMLL